MRILALIAARGGSKRIPNKNIRLLGGKPLIAWSIEVAIGIPEICDILVSTDDNEIAKVANDFGAMVPWLRPKELATDTASSIDVCLHALEWYERIHGEVDGLLLLQPTSPFRSRHTICRGIDLYRSKKCLAVVGVSPAISHPMWCFRIDGDYMIDYINNEGINKRSQDLEPAYIVNGSFYLTDPNNLRKEKTFIHDSTVPMVIDAIDESLDIDTEDDWSSAESILCNRSSHASYRDDSGRLNDSTREYLSENQIAFSLEVKHRGYKGKPRTVEMFSLYGIMGHMFDDFFRSSLRYAKSVVSCFGEFKRLSHEKGSMNGKRAILIGNGPSQGFLNKKSLIDFSNSGNDIIAVNYWNDNVNLSGVIPDIIVLSDPSSFETNEFNAKRPDLLEKSRNLVSYIAKNTDIKVFLPITKVDVLSPRIDKNRIYGFVNIEMSSLTSNIDPRFPRGYVSMTLYKALAIAIYLGYDEIYVIGMDNTYPHDVFCDNENVVYNMERHAGVGSYLLDERPLIPSMDVWAQDIFRLFHDIRRCFSGYNVFNLDCFSLTDAFPKVSGVNDIDFVLKNGFVRNFEN